MTMNSEEPPSQRGAALIIVSILACMLFILVMIQAAMRHKADANSNALREEVAALEQEATISEILVSSMVIAGIEVSHDLSVATDAGMALELLALRLLEDDGVTRLYWQGDDLFMTTAYCEGVNDIAACSLEDEQVLVFTRRKVDGVMRLMPHYVEAHDCDAWGMTAEEEIGDLGGYVIPFEVLPLDEYTGTSIF